MKKIINAAETVSRQLNSSSQDAPSAAPPKNTKPAASGTPAKKTPQDILDSGNIPAKGSVLIEDEYADINYSFRLSGDFIEFDSHCELSPSYQYEPYSSEDFTDYSDVLPNIAIGPNDDIYRAVESGKPIGNGYEKLDSRYFSFRTRLPYFGDILYCYGFSDGTAREREALMLTYSKDIEGTPLEKKLVAALDEAASTYTET